MKNASPVIYNNSPMIFVFGSNEGGFHGAGAAKTAVEKYGAIWGQGEGIQGFCYAIPTKDAKIETLPLDKIKSYVRNFLNFAQRNSSLQFYVTRIGCGLAGYNDSDIAPLFEDSPSNCIFDQSWKPYVSANDYFTF